MLATSKFNMLEVPELDLLLNNPACIYMGLFGGSLDPEFPQGAADRVPQPGIKT